MSAFFTKGSFGPLSAIILILIAGALMLLRSMDAERQLDRADAAYQKGAYEDSRKAYESANTGIWSAMPENRAKLLLGLGRVAYCQGNLAEAESQLKKSLEVAKSNDDDEVCASAQEALGDLYATLSRDEDAAEQYKQAAQYSQPETKDGWSHIYKILVKQTRYEQDYKARQKSATKASEIYTLQIKDIGDDASLALTRAYSNASDSDEFAAGSRQALALAETTRGKDNPLVADCLIAIAGTTEYDEERHRETVENYRRAYEIRRKCFGPAHLLTAKAEFLLGKELENKDGASLMDEAIKVQEKYLPLSRNGWDVINNIAVAAAEAEVAPGNGVNYWYDRAANIMRTYCESPLTIGILYYFRGQPDKAELLFKEALNQGVKEPRTRCHILFGLASFAEIKQDYAKAANYTRQGMEVLLTKAADFKSLKPTMSIDPTDLQHGVEFFLRHGEVEEARKFLNRGLQRAQVTDSDDHFYQSPVPYEAAVSFYTTIGDFDKAREFSNKLTDSKERYQALIAAIQGNCAPLESYLRKTEDMHYIDGAMRLDYAAIVQRYKHNDKLALTRLKEAIDLFNQSGLDNTTGEVMFKINLADVEPDPKVATQTYFEVSRYLDKNGLQKSIVAVIAENNCAKRLSPENSGLSRKLLEHADTTLQSINLNHPYRICVLRNLADVLDKTNLKDKAKESRAKAAAISSSAKGFKPEEAFAGGLINMIPFDVITEKPVRIMMPCLLEFYRHTELF